MLLQILFVLIVHSAAHAVSACSEMASSGDLCTLELSVVRPTQFAVGMREVNKKATRLAAKNPDELKDYLKSHPIEGIIGPEGVFYVIDGHHLARAAIKIGIRTAYGHVVRNYSDREESRFWNKMIKREWIYLNKLGAGPFQPQNLPISLDGLVDDPFRSLASAVRRAGGFKKSVYHYSEFQWADFFRKHIHIGEGESGFKRAISVGFVLAKSQLARELPGFIGWNKDCSAALVKNLERL